MRRAIIVHDIDNESLLYFTQAKLFFGPKNEGLEFVGDCITVGSWGEAYKIAKNNDIVLETGDYLTTTYRGYHTEDTGVRNVQWCEQIKGHDQCIIKFDKDKPINFKKRQYEQGSKQNYIIENVLKAVITSRKMLYLENTEELEISPVFYRLYPGPGQQFDYTDTMKNMKHFYGLASGWKTMIHAVKNNYESVIVYDKNQKQLNFSKMLHEHKVLPEVIEEKHGKEVAIYGKYAPTNFVKDNWSKWHNIDVKFELINLFDIPKFKPNSLVWTSNAFHYEATLFEYGYDYIKSKLKQLTKTNYDCIIITDT